MFFLIGGAGEVIVRSNQIAVEVSSEEQILVEVETEIEIEVIVS